MSFADTIGQVLTGGIDAAKQVLQTKYQVANPNPNTSSPGGVPYTAGQGALGSVAGIPILPLVLLAVGAVALVKLLRK